MAKAIVVGNVVSNAIVREVSENTEALNFTIAENETYPKGNGEVGEHVEYTDCVIYAKKGSLSGLANGLILQGQPLYLEGKTRRKVYRDENGNYTGENNKVVVRREDLKPTAPNPNKQNAA